MIRSIVCMHYMAGFSCLSGRCDINCCSGVFHIPFDRRDYENLQKTVSGSESMKSRVQSAFDMNVPAKYFGFLKMNENGRCTFLSANRLCEIHANFGDGALGTVCKTFPRVINILGDRAEVSGALSCPEVSWRLFLGLEPMKFVPISREDLPPGMLHYEKEIASEDVEIVDALRDVFIRILALEPYALQSRLYFLASFVEKIGRGNENGLFCSDTASIKRTFVQFIDRSNTDNLDLMIRTIKTDSNWPFEFLLGLITDKIGGSSSKECKIWLERYAGGNLDCCEPFIRWQEEAAPDLRMQLDRFLTLYFCNYIIARPPENRGVSHYIKTLITFGLLAKFIFVINAAGMPGSWGGKEGLDHWSEDLSAIFVKEMSSFSQFFEHEVQYHERMKVYFATHNVESFAHFVMMIKRLG